MDKLKPVLAHKYWIVFGLAMILPTAGWWIGTGSVKGDIDAATTAADGAFGSVPAPTSPNRTFAAAVEEINTRLAANNKEHNKYLWETQRNAMEWPASIHDEMQDEPFKGDVPIELRRMYRIAYFVQMANAPKDIADALSVENPTGKVAFDLGAFTPQAPDWGTSPPDSDVMWEVQEDYWLLKALLTAVKLTNEPYDNILQAAVKEIEVIELRGGDLKALKAGAAGGGAAGGDPTGAGPGGPMAGGPGMPGGDMRSGTGNPFGGGGSMQGQGQGQGQGGGDIDFDLADIFGPDTLQGGGGDMAGMPGAGGAGPGGGPANIAAGPGAFDAGAGGRGGEAKLRRYVDDEEGAPFKTRGFYLRVVIEQGKLPDLLVQLSSLDWPVEIVRVHQQIRNPDELTVIQGNDGGVAGMGVRGGRGGRTGMAGPGIGGAGLPGGRGGQLGRGQRGGRGGPGAAGRNQGRGGGSRFGGANALGGRGGATLPGAARGAMGTRSGMGPAAGIGMGRPGIGVLRDDEFDKAAEVASMYQAALAKPNLVDVVIAGKLTLFQPPPADDTVLAAANGNEQADEAASSETPADETEPAEGGGTKPAADAPADPDATDAPATEPEPVEDAEPQPPAGAPPAKSDEPE